MLVELFPAVLATTLAELKSRTHLAQKLSPTIHLDVMDGKFVSTKSVSIKTLQDMAWKGKVEIHAMVKNPTTLLPLLDSIKPRRVYLHVELGAALLPMIAVLRSRKIELGLAINPQTSITALEQFIPYAKSILVLSVHPGKYHAPLWPGAFSRIRTLRRRWPKLVIGADGSMNQSTIARAMKAGAQRLIVGSNVMLDEHPELAWKKLQTLTR